jgi:hypothetical protein
MSLTVNDQEQKWINWALLALLLLAAVPRFYALGVAPLIDDEYYLAKSILFVLDKGLPEFPNGGYYFRGVIQQYLTAPLLMLDIDREAALRFWPAVCNLLCLPLIFVIVRRLAGPVTALVAAVLFAFSIWEVEFARFARMYSPFQLVFLAYIYCLLRGVQDNCQRSLMIAYALSGIGIVVYEASAFLLLFNFLPWLLPAGIKFDRQFFIPLLLIVFFIITKFAIDPPELTAPSELGEGGHSGMFVLPPLLIPYVLSSPLWLVLWGAVALVSMWSIYQLWRGGQDSVLAPLVLSVAVLLAMLNLLGLAAAALLMAYLLLVLQSGQAVFTWPNRSLPPLLVIVFAGVFWLAFGMLNDAWLGKVSTLDTGKYGSQFVQLAGVLINFPEVAPRVIQPMVVATPLTTLALLLFTGIFGLDVLLRPSRYNLNHGLLLIILILSVLLVGMTSPFQKTSRYAFFLYPALLMTASLGMAAVSSLTPKPAMVLAGLGAVFMFVAEDYRFGHLMSLQSHDAVYRVNFDVYERNHYLARRDFESPMRYVNDNRRAGDVVVSAITPGDFYLEQQLDYMYIPKEANRFWERTVQSDRGLVDVWNNARLIYEPEAIMELVNESESAVWLVVFGIEWNGERNDRFRNRFSESLVYTSADGTIDVFEIRKD